MTNDAVMAAALGSLTGARHGYNDAVRVVQDEPGLYAFYGEDTGVRVARKHLGWYLTKLQHGTELRRELMAAENSSLQFALTRRGLEGWADGKDAT